MDLDPKGELFYNADGKKKRTCDLEGPDHGCSGADWWFELDYSYDTELGDLRAFTHMKFLGQKAQESAAERYYSLVDNVQSKKKGSMRPKYVEKRCLFLTELLQDRVCEQCQQRFADRRRGGDGGQGRGALD